MHCKQAQILSFRCQRYARSASGSAAVFCFFQVWRSIRDWDPQSRGMLSTYLQAAKDVVQTKQARPGVAVHVRLGGDDSDGGDKDKQGGSGSGNGASRTGVASSYAVWAVTGGWVGRLFVVLCGMIRCSS